MAQQLTCLVGSVGSPTPPNSAFQPSGHFGDTQREDSLAVAIPFPSPQRAETPTPHLVFKRLPQWQEHGASYEAPKALHRPIFAESREEAGCGKLGGCVRGGATPERRQEVKKPPCRPLPAGPQRPQKQRAAAERLWASSRSGSLAEEKLLYQTQLVRSHSTFKFLDNFIVEAEIGESQHSKVFKVRHRTSGQDFALKRSAKRFSSKADRDRCLHELSSVSSLSAHPNIVSYYRAWQQDKYVYIQMALCEGGSLADQIHRVHSEGAGFVEQRLVDILSDLSTGLEFLHSHHVLHLDIKPENIFLDTDDRCKIGDFGLAIQDEEEDWQEGDGAYLAPELLSIETVPTPAADIYSAGATLYECCTGSRLPSDKENLGQADLGVSPALSALVLRMLEGRPECRPPAAALRRAVAEIYAQHPDWSEPMERVASLCEAPQTNEDELGMSSSEMTSSRIDPGHRPAYAPELGPQSPQPLGQHNTPNATNTPFGLVGANAMTPPISPLASAGDWQHPHAQHQGWQDASQADGRLEDTAFCARRKQPARERWSRRSLSSPVGATPLVRPAAVGSDWAAAESVAAAKPRPKIAATRPFTAMAASLRSPFADAAWQECGGCDGGLAQPFNSGGHSASRSRFVSKSSEMDDLQSTVRCLNMS